MSPDQWFLRSALKAFPEGLLCVTIFPKAEVWGKRRNTTATRRNFSPHGFVCPFHQCKDSPVEGSPSMAVGDQDLGCIYIKLAQSLLNHTLERRGDFRGITVKGR